MSRIISLKTKLQCKFKIIVYYEDFANSSCLLQTLLGVKGNVVHVLQHLTVFKANIYLVVYIFCLSGVQAPLCFPPSDGFYINEEVLSLKVKSRSQTQIYRFPMWALK